MLNSSCNSVLLGFLFGLIAPWMKFIILDRENLDEYLRKCSMNREVMHPAEATSYSYKLTQSEPYGALSAEARSEDIYPTLTNSSENWNKGKRVRILCWFMTDPKILSKTRNVKDTWTKQCDVRLFMSSELDRKFPTVGLGVQPGRNHIAAKSRASWAYIFANYFDQADFFMKADPDSYIIMENLKLFLSERSPDGPEAYGHALFFGQQAWLGNFSGFYTAGQSVVLSREGLRRLASGGIDHKYFVDGQAEDLKTIVCLENRGGYLIDTRDLLGRETFMPAIGLSSVLAGNFPSWYTDHYRTHLGYCQTRECLSPFPIVFHYVTSEMYLIDYLVNGVNQNRQRQIMVEKSIEGGFLRFNGSILARLTGGDN